MPELPEVETIMRELQEPLVGRVINGAWNDWPRHIAGPDVREFLHQIRGLQITSVSRRGKYIVIGTDDGRKILIHLKMSGQLLLTGLNALADKHVHTRLFLDDGRELRFRDVRKFGRIHLLSDAESVLGKLGPEPLSADFSASILARMMAGRRRIVKPLLLDQTFIAGIGNIYADEALHVAKVRPARKADSLSFTEVEALYDGIRVALLRGLAAGGATIDDYRRPDGGSGRMQEGFMVYGRSGEPCYRCEGTIQRILLGGRGTHFCSRCQS